MFTDYPSMLDYLYQKLPMFQRVGAVAYKKDLSNTIHLCRVLGNPEKKIRTIHVAGTNGKGSSSHMLAAILQTAGYKTGLYTSPHLKDFTERIKINGVPIQKQFVVDFISKLKPVIDQISPSFFEITAVMAFDYFAQEKVDLAVIEVGVGGRLDSTNVISPLVSLITNIGFDHKDLLGNTLKEIAAEKAGIIKRNVPVIISERQEEVEEVFLKKAKSETAELHYADECVAITEVGHASYKVVLRNKPYIKDLALDLKGNYQLKNLFGVVAVVDQLNSMGFKIDAQHVKSGLKDAAKKTGLKGRWQILGQRPYVVCDTGHNAEGISAVLNQIDQMKFNQLHIVWGMVKDKDPDDILRLLPKNAKYYFCQASIPRALDVETLANKAKSNGINGTIVKDVNDGMRIAKSMAQADDFIFVGGSTFVVAEIDDL